MLGIASKGSSEFFTLDNLANTALGIWKITEDGKTAAANRDAKLQVTKLEQQNLAIKNKNIMLATIATAIVAGAVVLKKAKVI